MPACKCVCQAFGTTAIMCVLCYYSARCIHLLTEICPYFSVQWLCKSCTENPTTLPENIYNLSNYLHDLHSFWMPTLAWLPSLVSLSDVHHCTHTSSSSQQGACIQMCFACVNVCVYVQKWKRWSVWTEYLNVCVYVYSSFKKEQKNERERPCWVMVTWLTWCLLLVTGAALLIACLHWMMGYLIPTHSTQLLCTLAEAWGGGGGFLRPYGEGSRAQAE